MILSILAALFGSGLGGAVRAGVTVAERRLGTADATDEPVAVSGSLVAALVAGTLCNTFGRSLRVSFWVGAVLGAAGTERLDWWVLRRFGVDPERLMAQARAAAGQKAAQVRSRAESTAEGL